MYMLLSLLLISPVLSQFNEEELFSERSVGRNSSNPDKPCPSGTVCTLSESCPIWSKQYNDFTTNCRGNPRNKSCSNLLKNLQKAICNREDQAFCCPICPSGKACIPASECPDYTRKIAEIRTKQRGSTRCKQLFTKLEGRVCDTQTKSVCCQKNNLVEVRTTGKDIGSPLYLPRGENCGVNPEQTPSKIFGGDRTNAGDFPFAALVGISEKRKSSLFVGGTYAPAVVYTKWICGGTLINHWYVVTAAHCQSNQARNKISGVRLGDFIVDGYTRSKSEEDLPPFQDFAITPSDVIVHNKYRRTRNSLENDIALIRLPKATKFNAGVQMVCLPLDETKTALALRLSDLDRGLEGRETTVIGWGHTCYKKDSVGQNTLEFCRDSTVIPSRLQQYIEIPVVKREECLFAINSTLQFCAGESNKDTCKGDSGGGVFVRDNQGRPGLNKPWYLMGIVSFGTTICGSGQPAVYTKVSSYSDWIIDNIRN